MNNDDLDMNELAADDAASVDAEVDALADSHEPAAALSPRTEGKRARGSGAFSRRIVRICLGLVTVVALSTMFLRGGSEAGLRVEGADLVLHLQPAEIYGKALVKFKDQRLDDESSLQQMLSEQPASGEQRIVLRTAGGVSQSEIDRISRLIRRNLPEARILIVGSSGSKSGE